MNKWLILYGMCIAVITWGVCKNHYKRKMYYEYKRGLFVGIDYYTKHDHWPSYWHWNHKYYNPDFNMDTVLIITQDSVKRLLNGQ